MLPIRETEDFAEWLANLADARAAAQIAARVDRMSFGLIGDVKPVGDGVSEARIHYGPGYRLYFVQRGRELIVLLCGGDKSSQRRDIARAKALAAKLPP
jgi:putative addiction module killer protein